MPLAQINCRGQIGLEAPLVKVEVHLSYGLPQFHIVGLPEKAVQESRERVRCALQYLNFAWPDRRITVNLAPADLPKQGGRFDLAIALGILAASEQIPTAPLEGAEFFGELTLSGQIRFVPGLLPALLAAKKAGHRVYLPQDNITEAGLVADLQAYAVDHLGHLLQLWQKQAQPPLVQPQTEWQANDEYDLAEVKGQAQAKRALLIAAVGGHHLLFSGPPGSGKSMLAQRLPSLLPPLSEEQALEQAMIASISAQGLKKNWRRRPFRNPHHTASATALVGGGTVPQPGEISLAHHGVLFLDELPEFPRSVLEVLREPLENGYIEISRAKQKLRFPAQFQLVAAMNPCPCGYYGDERQACRCTPAQIQRYRHKLSGPLLDRIDLQVHVPNQPPEVLLNPSQEKSSAELRQQVIAAREQQKQRQSVLNAHLQGQALEEVAALGAKERQFMQQALQKLGLSARSHHKIIRVARSIADLEQQKQIQIQHLSEAISYRRVL